MALAAEGVRARIYSCRKAFRLNWALAPAALFHLRKGAFPQTLKSCSDAFSSSSSVSCNGKSRDPGNYHEVAIYCRFPEADAAMAVVTGARSARSGLWPKARRMRAIAA